jgi:hypothetical protein
MGRGLNMSQVKEIWGNGTDVIIKFTRDVGDIWWAASEWMSVSYPYTEHFLKANGYRRLKWQD